MLQNSKHPDKLTAYLNERRKNFEKSKNEIEKTATINTASSNLIFLLATMPMGLSQTQLKIIDVSYENEVNRINIISSRFKTKLNENMIELSWGAIEDSDVVLFLVEANSKGIGRGDSKILEKLKESNKKCILIICSNRL